jgi:autotransporter-associated beta strand protein
MTVAMTICTWCNAAAAADSTGILKKPIPDKLVVLTFDDGPASHYTVVTPILKELGFGGSFYVCDFDSFRTRKDWYLSWRQMREMIAAGFEIGNHTSGHAGGASIGYFLNMDDALIANGVPKTTTIAWPVHHSNPKTYPDLTANGYVFGRGGYYRPYYPTVDNPFDIPCMAASNIEDFPKVVRQAAGGQIVVLIYHGVPDIEHPRVSTDPAVFRAQMQYLKDNHYKVIALRDLAEYIDPAKAAQLPPTSRAYKPSGPEPLASEEKPPVAVRVAVPPTALPVASVEKPEAKLNLPEFALPDNNAPIVLDIDKALHVAKGPRVELRSEVSGPGKLVKTGAGEVRLWNAKNSFSGGTLVHGGTLTVEFVAGALSSGPVTVEDGTIFRLDAVKGANPLTFNGGAFDGSGHWNADIRLNQTVLFSGSLALNNQQGGISGPGGVVMAGAFNPWGSYVGQGTLTLAGNNSYTGTTEVQLGALVLAKSRSLYGGDTSQWTAENFSVRKSATLVLKCGGPEEFSEEQVNLLVTRLHDARGANGLRGGAVLCLDVTSAQHSIVLKAKLADALGTDGGGFNFRKSGDGTLVLAGENTFTGLTHIERGWLSVNSLNRVGQGRAESSSLGSPGTEDAGEILLGEGDGTVPKGDAACGLIYTGNGESTDRALNFAGRNSTVTFEHAGTGLLKLGGPLVFSGYGGNKQIILSGTGTGELAGNLIDPHDRMGKAKTSLTKTGSGSWTLSGSNTHTGPTQIKQGTLRIVTAKSLGKDADIHVTQGAKLDLAFAGEATIASLTLGGTTAPSGKYTTTATPEFISGPGTLIVP